ncbi:hypothetical protein BDZ89DRAFT_1145630 [Hymenopellis radicata]|nr:hypothetical protein BDZ89DRAFT_1145630 [Hymenopellis radicata]
MAFGQNTQEQQAAQVHVAAPWEAELAAYLETEIPNVKEDMEFWQQIIITIYVPSERLFSSSEFTADVVDVEDGMKDASA